MSVMIIAEASYERLLHSLLSNYNYRIRNTLEAWVREKFRKNNMYKTITVAVLRSELKKEVEGWHRANFDSYCERYGHIMKPEEKLFQPCGYTRQYRSYSDIEVYKLLGAIRYNIEIEDFDSTLIDMLESLYPKVIVENMPEYENASI